MHFINYCFKTFFKQNKKVAEKSLRHLMNDYDQILPCLLEIPSKEHPYEAKKVISLYFFSKT